MYTRLVSVAMFDLIPKSNLIASYAIHGHCYRDETAFLRRSSTGGSIPIFPRMTRDKNGGGTRLSDATDRKNVQNAQN